MATHTHRVGRTGRADETGWAFSLAGMDEMALAGQIEQAGGSSSEWHALDTLTPAGGEPLRPSMATRQILGGRKEQVRAGDVLGALSQDQGFAAARVGKISVNEFFTHVAVERGITAQVLQRLSGGKIKGRSVKVRLLDDGASPPATLEVCCKHGLRAGIDVNCMQSMLCTRVLVRCSSWPC